MSKFAHLTGASLLAGDLADSHRPCALREICNYSESETRTSHVSNLNALVWVHFQFVPFRDFVNRGAVSADLLAKEVLAEVPGQLLSYMTSRSIKPSPPPPISANQITFQAPTDQQAPVHTNHSAPYPAANASAPYPCS